jgi:membrane-bound inhibitor of C-type lysozyme
MKRVAQGDLKMNARPIPRETLWITLGAALAFSLAAGSAVAQATLQPPMNDFNQAYYRCDGGAAFMMTYESDQPATAEMAANDDNKHHELKRSPSPAGVQFTGGGVKFWTDGKTVVVEGTKSSFKNCRTKPG